MSAAYRSRRVGGEVYHLPAGASVTAWRTVVDKKRAPQCLVLITRVGQHEALVVRGPVPRDKAIEMVRAFNEQMDTLRVW